MHDTLLRLTELLRELPGIGPRQARRLAHWLLTRERAWVEELARTLLAARREVGTCGDCMRLFPAHEGAERCDLCANDRRDAHTLLIVEKDVDLENIERTGAYRGRYFVLGGSASPLDREPERKVRLHELTARLTRDPGITEVICALSATTEGEDTATLIADRLNGVLTERGTKLTHLGRGLSTGTELEYVDADTMKNALRGRY